MGDSCESSYCKKIDEVEKDMINWIIADGNNTQLNNERIKTIEQLGGPTVLKECDKSFNWYLRWWMYRYDFESALKIAHECYDRQMDFAHTGSPHGYFMMERSLKSIYGPLSDYVYLLDK